MYIMELVFVTVHIYLIFLFDSHQHQKNTHEFWRENGGDKKLKKDFLLSADDYAK